MDTDEQRQLGKEFITYWDRIITAWNPSPSPDDNTPLLGQHPCSIPYDELQGTKSELAELLNWVERHRKCMPGYCQVKRKVPGSSTPQLVCRFDYPMNCRETAGLGFDSKGRVRFEPRRNDPLLNTHNRAMIFAWRANVDIKPVLSESAALRYDSAYTMITTHQLINIGSYIAKYASKAESNAPAFPALLSDIVAQMSDTATVQSACQKPLNKILGERMYSAQETAHLLLSIPSCALQCPSRT